jgi:hypothetical protein
MKPGAGLRCRYSRMPCAVGPESTGIRRMQVWITQEPHNDLNRTTPGTNLLPSINHAQKAAVTCTTSVQRRQCGLGMGGS